MLDPKSIALACVILAGPAAAQVTELVTVSSSGAQSDFDADYPPSAQFVSADGRFVVFWTDADNLVPGDTNGLRDIFVRDRLNGTTERVSIDSSGLQGNGHSGLYGFSISSDGRFVAFESASNNLVPGDTNGAREVFIHDRTTGVTEFIAVDSNGVQGNGASFYPSVSGDGHFVAFTSDSTNLVPGDTNGKWDTFVRDRWAGTTERISVNFSGVQGNDDSYKPEISPNGRFVVFESAASNLVGGDVLITEDVFLRDRLFGTTRRASVTSSGIGSVGPSNQGSVSDDGRFVSFVSWDPNLVAGDTNLQEDVYVHDFLLGTTERVSLASNGAEANNYSVPLALSGDGRYVLFGSPATNLVPNDGNANSDVFLRDRLLATTERVNLAGDGTEANLGGGRGSMSSDARYVAFLSLSTNLVSGDVNGRRDVFVRDRQASGFASLCDPGQNQVIVCPCGNQPSGRSRGCDNSSSTGGASISAGGIAYLSTDSLAFTTSAERPAATSVLLQGTALVPNGVVFGQGVRCAGGQLERMYVKTAVNGSIIAPDLSTNDPTVSARSAQLGVAIQPGQPYEYLVYYRDPIVSAGCPATSTFNATQTGSVTWWP